MSLAQFTFVFNTGHSRTTTTAWIMKGDLAPLQEAREVLEDLLEKPHQVGEIKTAVDPSHTPRGPRSWVNAESGHMDRGCSTRITSIHIPAHRIHSGAAGGLLHLAQAALPPVQHRQSPHGPIHGPPSHRAPLFHENHPSHTSPSRHFHGPPSDRRIPSPHSSFRGPQRRPKPSGTWQKLVPHSSGEALWPTSTCRAPLEWPGGYPHPPRGDSRLSGPPQRKFREFHGRSAYPERYKNEAVQAG